MSEQANNKVLITGASSEIGVAIARKFDQPGNFLLLHAFKNSSKLLEIVKEFKAETKIIECDFSDSDSFNNFLEKLTNIDIFVNAASVTIADILVSLSEQDINKMLSINIFSAIRICQKVLPSMIVKHRGIILNISSIAATKSNRGQSVYGGTKAFLESFTRSIATEYGMKGIRANCIAPGAIAAGSLKGLLNMASDEIIKNTSVNHLGTPDDVAEAVYFLCSSKNSFINGAVLPVDGGFMKGL